ncbi:sulfatase [Anaerolinea sp.]|uniref:sulfatase n=1 Tax=Anaerolinea sp. TaxID=1872519 RepID=UPI002ACE5ED3|nr:sulfatase [Anaerolinea sp.]
MMLKRLSPFSSRESSWSGLFLTTSFSVFAYALLEWLFLTTKPSAIAILPFSEKLRILLLSFALVNGAAYLLLAGLLVVWLVLRWNLWKRLGVLLPAGILSGLTLLLVDNFTYTLFHFGVSTSAGWSRALYLLGFLIVLYLWTREVSGWLAGLTIRQQGKRAWITPAALSGLTVLLLGLTYVSPQAVHPPLWSAGAAARKTLPHILLITADGLNANHLSAYGYERDTTPNLRRLAEHSLVGENAYSNSANTAGGVVAILTGKYPTTNRLLYPPDALKGENAFQHLPYILKTYGYTSVQYSFPYFVDAYTLNIQSGFDVANGTVFRQSAFLSRLQNLFDESSAGYLYELINRLADRLRHIFFLKDMTNYRLLLPTNPQALPFEYRDEENLHQVLDTLTTSNKPVFAHLHWMGTHPLGRKFYPKVQVFSQGQSVETQGEFNPDFYDDKILEFDQALGEILDTLDASGLMDQTIVVIASDHGFMFNNLARLPWIIHFPEDAYARRIRQEVQNIDIAPTLLEYLGIPIPEWMEGNSVLRADPGNRLIFGTGVGDTVRTENGFLVEETVNPPFYNFGFVSVVSCNQWHRLKLNSRIWESGQIADGTAPCTPIAEEEAFRLIVQHLQERGFDTSTLSSFAVVQRP